MVYNCAVPGCLSSRNDKGRSFYRFPNDSNRCKRWIAASGRADLAEKTTETLYKSYRICDLHFKNTDLLNKILKRNAVPTQNLPQDVLDLTKYTQTEYSIPQRASFLAAGLNWCSVPRLHILTVSEQEAQLGASPSVMALGTITSLDSNISNASSNACREQDPLSGTIEQCRLCGEFSKDCLAVSGSMPYLAANKTTLALNDTSVQLDFNNHSLPSTVCRHCDAKLREIANFLKVVKAAQDTFINVAVERDVGKTGVEFEVVRSDVPEETAIDTLVIKTEYDSQDEEGDSEKEDKEGIVDSLTAGETIFVKKSASNKRKSDTVTAKPKKPKVIEYDSELIVDIKEEVIETEDGQGHSEISDSDVKPSELGHLELATSALMFEMAGDGTIEYQGYRSDR